MPVTEKKKTASRPKTAAKKKKTTSSPIRLSADEKKLVQNYRKSNLIEKKLLDFAAEKFAEGIDAASVVNLLRTNL